MAIPTRTLVFNGVTVSATNGTATSSAINVKQMSGDFKVEGTVSGSNTNIKVEYFYSNGTTTDATAVEIISAVTGTDIQKGFVCDYTPYLVFKLSNTGSGDATVTMRLLGQERD